MKVTKSDPKGLIPSLNTTASEDEQEEGDLNPNPSEVCSNFKKRVLNQLEAMKQSSGT